jgi:hypothetical protein
MGRAPLSLSEGTSAGPGGGGRRQCLHVYAAAHMMRIRTAWVSCSPITVAAPAMPQHAIA